MHPGSSHPCSVVTNPNGIHEGVSSIPGLAQWVEDLAWRDLWCRSWTWLQSGVAVAVVLAGSYSSDLTPSLGTSYAASAALKRQSINASRVRPVRRQNSQQTQIYSRGHTCSDHCTSPGNMTPASDLGIKKKHLYNRIVRGF